MADASEVDGRFSDRQPIAGHWRSLFERSLNPMLVSNDEREILEANPAVCLLLRTPAEGLRGLRIDDLTPPETRGEVPALFEAFLAVGSQAGAFTLFLPDQTKIEVEYAATANIQSGQHLSIFLVWPALDEDGDAEAGDAAVTPDYQPHPKDTGGELFILSTREREVLTLLALGEDGEKIAAQLFISPATVRTHVQNARYKLGATTRAQAVAVAIHKHEISAGLSPAIPSLGDGRGSENP